MWALTEIPRLYSDLNHLLPREQSAGSGSPVSGTRERQLPLRLDVLTMQEDLEAMLRDHAARIRGFVLPPRRVAVAVAQDSQLIRVRLSALLALDQGETGAQAGIYYLRWQLHARRMQGQHKQVKICKDIPCPVCDHKSLVKEYGCDTTDCRSCGKRISSKDYEAWCTYLIACDNLKVARKKK